MSEATVCPYCGTSDAVVTVYNGDPSPHGGYSLYHCDECDAPFVTVSRVTIVTTVHKVNAFDSSVSRNDVIASEMIEDVDGAMSGPVQLVKCDTIEKFIDTLPPRTCFKCGQQFNSENPCKLQGEIVCDDCYNEAYQEDEGGTQPDQEQFHCQECGCIYPIGFREERTEGTMCSSCWAERDNQKIRDGTVSNQPVQSTEQETDEEEYVPLPGSKTVSYHINGDTVRLQYKGSDCNGYTFDVIWDIVDSPKADWMKTIDEMVKGENNHNQKASALNQFCKAVKLNTVKIPGSEE